MEWGPFYTVSGAVVTAIVTVIGTMYVARTKAKTDIGSSITAGFKELTDQLQEERSELMEIVEKLRHERSEDKTSAEAMEALIRKMRAHIYLLERILRKADIDVPEHELF